MVSLDHSELNKCMGAKLPYDFKPIGVCLMILKSSYYFNTVDISYEKNVGGYTQ